jgi:DNA-binding NarL/FixJ family response regulator
VSISAADAATPKTFANPLASRVLIATGPKLPAIVDLVSTLRAAGVGVGYTDDLAGVDPASCVVLVAGSLSAPVRVAQLSCDGFQVFVVLDDDAVVSPVWCIAAGASAVVESTVDPDDLAAILALTRNGMCVVPSTAPSRAAALSQAQVVAALSSTERTWLREASGGMTLAEIAEAHGWSVRTVHRRMQRIYEKLGVTGLAQALAVVASWDSIGF